MSALPMSSDSAREMAFLLRRMAQLLDGSASSKPIPANNISKRKSKKQPAISAADFLPSLRNFR